MRFSAVLVASLASTAVARPVAEATVVKDLEGFTKLPVAARQLNTVDQALAGIKTVRSDIIHEAKGSDSSSPSNIIHEAEGDLPLKNINATKTLPVQKRSDLGIIGSLTTGLPIRDVAGLVDNAKFKDLPSKGKRSDLISELVKELGLRKRQNDLVTSVTKILEGKRSDEAVADLSKLAAEDLDKRQTDILSELSKALSGKRDDELSDLISLRDVAELVSNDEFRDFSEKRQVNTVTSITKDLGLGLKRRQGDLLTEGTEALNGKREDGNIPISDSEVEELEKLAASA